MRMKKATAFGLAALMAATMIRQFLLWQKGMTVKALFII